MNDFYTQEKVNRDSDYKIRKAEERRRRDKKHRQESRSHSPRKRESSSHTSRSSSHPDLKRTRTEKREANTAKNSCQEYNGGVAQSGGLLPLTEVSFIFLNMLILNNIKIFVFYNSEAAPGFNDGK